jgi:uncharacterized protein (TIGR03382 family)
MKSMLAALVLSSLAGVAAANVSFAFGDPAHGRQVTNTVVNNVSTNLSYNNNFIVPFIIDGQELANPFKTTVNARVLMDLNVGTGLSVAGVYQAPVTGNFQIVDAATGALLLRADAGNGTFLRVGNTSSVLFSDTNGFAYTKGAGLEAILAANGNAGLPVLNPQEGVFTMTQITTGGLPVIGANGRLNAFTANASFSGNFAIPTPGAAALAGLGLIAAGRRRR